MLGFLWCLPSMSNVFLDKALFKLYCCCCRPVLLHRHPIRHQHCFSMADGQDEVFAPSLWIFTKNWYNTLGYTTLTAKCLLAYIHNSLSVSVSLSVCVLLHTHTHIRKNKHFSLFHKHFVLLWRSSPANLSTALLIRMMWLVHFKQIHFHYTQNTHSKRAVNSSPFFYGCVLAAWNTGYCILLWLT